MFNYRNHYKDILGRHLSDARLAELFLFRGWTAQFGYRICSSNRSASEKLIGETVNSSKYLGLKIFQQTHGFSVEDVLGSDFISLIEDRWRDYDGAVEKRTTSGLPTSDVVSALTRRLDVADPVVTFKLSADFQQQMELITKTSIEIGLLKV